MADGSPEGPRTLVFESGDIRRPTTRVSRVEIPGEAGTHVLAPYFLDLDGATLDQLDVKTFFGEGMIVRFRFSEAGAVVGAAEIQEGASTLLQSGDVVLLANLAGAENAPSLSPEAAQWLVESGAKMVGFGEDFLVDIEGSYETHRIFLDARIPIIRNLVNLDQCSGGRLAAIALPLAMTGLASSPVRVLLLD